MAIRKTNLSWSAYKKAAKTIKTINPQTTPQQIIGRLGYPVKNGVRIRITSDGQGGIKQRNISAQQSRERVRQKRLRIQTGQLSPEQAAETRAKKDTIRAAGDEADHINESWLIGEQLERLEAAGGDVQAALARLRAAGYTLGNEPGNIQALSPEENKEKYQQNRALQERLGAMENLGQSPSARRPDLIVTETAPPEPLGGFQTQQPKINSTAGTIHFKPQPLGGFDTTAAPQIEQEVFAPDDSVRQPTIQRFAAKQMDYATSPQRADQQIEQLQTAAGMALTVGASLLKTAGGIISYGLMK